MSVAAEGRQQVIFGLAAGPLKASCMRFDRAGPKKVSFSI